MLKATTINKLKSDKIPVNDFLPPLEVRRLRSSEVVANRVNILGIFIAICDDSNSIPFFKDLIKKQALITYLSDSEKIILEKGQLSEQEEIDKSWYRESLYCLCWCLGIFEEMIPPKQEADIYPIFNYIPPEVDLGRFVEKATLIKKSKISDEAEYYYGLHWAIRHPESWNILSNRRRKKYSISIVRERRRALEWVIDDQLNWDEVSLDT